MMNILILDGHNLFHRARSGFALGDHFVTYNFFKSLKALVEKFEPGRVLLTLEGHPKKRHELLPEYKANRIVDVSTPEGKIQHELNVQFFRQVDEIVELLSECFPVSVIRHPDHEADDVIYNVINNASRAVQFTVVSTDSDFVQLLQDFENVKLYNPVKKTFVEAPEDYNYVHWKALRGDGSDNIPGLPGVNDAKAVEILTVVGKAKEMLNSAELTDQWRKNCQLIRFMKWDDEETKLMTSSAPAKDWERVKAKFTEFAFQSMLTEKYWPKFQSVFDKLWE